ncbi:MAG TPA: pyruvate kinase [bacterium]|nr:pyruvate kinase [bacterium]HPN80935.1 pyruvate kinase [bacterium]HPW39402.1 pyruvate kinase [bacterium]
MKKTKIVATIGPVSETKTMMEKMITAGMNVARLNFSHGSYDHHQLLINNLRAVAKKGNRSVAVLQDLQGPRIRIGDVAPEGITVEKGAELFLVPENYVVPIKALSLYIPIQYPDLYKEVKVGQSILIDDAVIELKIERIKNRAICCRVVTGGVIKTHKGMNFPQSTIKCPPITAKDWQDLEFGIKNKVDFVALSFVKAAEDVIKLRRRIFALEKKYWKNSASYGFKLEKPAAKGKIGGIHTRIIAKIERREAVKNIDSILEAADGIMVARGDLGIEVPFEDLPLIQKNIIDKCRKAGKQVIVATQMLDSMIRNPLPTRAEVSDVANAILDGTDAIMLSGETATGKYPLKAVRVMSRIAREVEGRLIDEQEVKEGEFKNLSSITQIMSFVAQDLAEDVAHAKLIVCATTSGFTARNISRFRSEVPIIAIAPAMMTVNQLSLSWGVEAHLIKFTASFNSLLAKIKKLLLDKKLAVKGDTVIVVAGHPFGFKGQTNLIKVEEV